MKNTRKLFFVALLIAVVAFLVNRYFFHPNVYPAKSIFFAWAGDTKFYNSTANTIGHSDLIELRSLIRPGDIILNRSDFYFSNIGIPGFWTHASIYVGTPKERTLMFKGDSDCAEWVNAKGEKSGSLEKLLYKEFDSIYNANTRQWKEMNIIESISEGVVISSFEAGAKKDGIVILRPMISNKEIVEGIYKSFAYVTKPYDYNFDFSTEEVIACTELVFKVYENSKLFPVNDMFGKPFSTANEIAEYCDANYENPDLKLKMIYIFDGENGYTAQNDTAHVIFRKSWDESLW